MENVILQSKNTKVLIMMEFWSIIKQAIALCWARVKVLSLIQILDVLCNVFIVFLTIIFLTWLIASGKIGTTFLSDKLGAEILFQDPATLSNTKLILLGLLVIFLGIVWVSVIIPLQIGAFLSNPDEKPVLSKFILFVKKNFSTLFKLHLITTCIYAIFTLLGILPLIIIYTICLFADYFVIFASKTAFHAIVDSFHFIKRNWHFTLSFIVTYFFIALAIPLLIPSSLLVFILLSLLNLIGRATLMIFFLNNNPLRTT